VTEGDAFDWLPALLVLQGVMGTLDTIVNHELVEALPRRPEARGERSMQHCFSGSAGLPGRAPLHS
jgi:hypothetical protein